MNKLLDQKTLAVETEYKVLAPLPGTTKSGDTTDLETYLPGLFNLLIGLGVVFAVIMTVIGGFQYISSDALQGKSDGRKRIQNALLGLVFVAGAWLILYTIDPKLVSELNLNIDTINLPQYSGGTLSGGGLQQSTQEVIAGLRTACSNCSINITSTTGGQHSEGSLHYQGLAVDIAADRNLNQYLTNSPNNPTPCTRVTRTIEGHSTTFLWETTGSKCGGTVASTGDHWHMSVTP